MFNHYLKSFERRRFTAGAAALLLGGLALDSTQAGSYEDFFSAITRDDGAAITRLLQRGFDPNTRNETANAGLHLCMQQGTFVAAQALIEHPHIEVDAVNAAGETPLMLAAIRGHTAWMEKLLERGAGLHRPGWAPIHYAASGTQLATLKLLIARGAPVDARSPNGSTPLMMAAGYGPEDAVRLLLKEGADPALRNDLKLSAADFARNRGRERLAEALEQLR